MYSIIITYVVCSLFSRLDRQFSVFNVVRTQFLLAPDSSLGDIVTINQKEKVENNFYRHGLKVTFPNSVCAATSGYNGTCFRWKYFPHQQVHDQRSMSSTSPSLLILICRHHSSDHSYQCRTLSIIAPIFALYNHHHLKKLNWIFHQNHHLHPKSVA